jgi:hypothetical protein
MITSPLGKLVLPLVQDEVQKFVIHLAVEDRPFATARATRMMVVENEEFSHASQAAGRR